MSLATKLLICGGASLLLSLLILVIAGAANFIPWRATFNKGDQWGILPGTFWFWQTFNFDPGWTGGGRMFWSASQTTYQFLTLVICVVAAVMQLIAIIISIKKKNIVKNLPTIAGLGVSVFYLGYLIVSMNVALDKKVLWRTAYFAYIFVIAFAVISAVAFVISYLMSFKVADLLNKIEDKKEEEAEAVKEEEPKAVAEGLKEEEVREIVRDELAKQPKEEVKEEAKEDEVDEERVREIVRDEMAKRPVTVVVEREAAVASAQAAVTEVAEEEEEEEAEDDEEIEEEVVEEGADDNGLPDALKRNRRRRASFETKLKNSEYDLRHKYYDLRDYIKSYGIKNRISIPGDTFSAHREKYVFLTIVGKHIKASFALNPDDYAETPIPVARNESKRFEDLPLSFKIKSDLSFRRACKLVDDVMAAKGVEKPAEEKK